jgi:hypothetical protein
MVPPLSNLVLHQKRWPRKKSTTENSGIWKSTGYEARNVVFVVVCETDKKDGAASRNSTGHHLGLHNERPRKNARNENRTSHQQPMTKREAPVSCF